MAVSIAKIATTNYRRMTDDLTTSGGGEGYDGMTQLVFRMSRGPESAIAESEYNLPDPADFTAQKLEGAASGLIYMWSRTIRPDSPQVVISNVSTPNSARIDKKVELILSPAQTVKRYWTKEEGSASDVVEIPAESTMLNIRAGDVSASYQNLRDLVGFTVLDKVGSGQYNNAMLHHISWFKAGTGPSLINVGGRAEERYIDIFADVSLTLVEDSATAFQIKVNGQLIPATPNLWSGGQLTPVGLNLPE